MAKKSLADQISDLYAPTTGDFDIEDAENTPLFDHDERGSDDEGSQSDDDDDEQLRAQHYVEVGKSNLRGEDGVALKGERYQGKSSSRAEIFDDNDEDQEDEDEHLESEEGSERSGEESEEDDQLNGGDDEEISEEELEDQEEVSDDSEIDEQESQDDDEDDDDDEQTTTTSDKRAKLKALMSSERKLIINRLSTATQTDAIKGYAVISQQQQFDNIIDIRMKLQKAVTNSNLLPLNSETYEELIEDETNEKLSKAEKLLHGLLDNILMLRTQTYNKENLTKEPLKYQPSKKRTFTQYAEETAKLDSLLNKHRESVLTKWSHKVDSASGANALNGTKFKSLNSNAAQQVQLNLMDMERLVKRTRVNRRDVKPLGFTDETQENGDEEEDQDKKQIDRSLKDREDIFDDEDFYRVLLNDLVDKKLTSQNPTSGLTIQLTKASKFKKNVDTKASKGRKLRYTVQEKIVNFDAPRGKFVWSDEQIDEFCAGLLGQKVDFNEDRENEEDDDDNDEEELKNDDLRIFG